MKDSITSTLFRFVSLRSPKLIDEPTKNAKFVLQPKTLHSGIFYDAIDNLPVGSSKKEALIQAAQNFSGKFSSVEEIRSLNNKLYDFSVWLLPNRSDYDVRELQERINSVGEPLGDAKGESLQKVWDNLFYQIITQESFYIKEALMQMLVADHLKRRFKDGEDALNNKLANARVVIPALLFDESTTEKSTLLKEKRGTITPALPDKSMKKKLAIAKAEFSNESIKSLRSELVQLEKKYKDDFHKSYEKAYQTYQNTNAPKIKQYDDDLEAARKQYCSIKPDVQYNPQDPCQQPDLVPYPDIPEFTFSFKKEIVPEELEQQLSYDSYITLLDVLGYKFDESQDKNSQQRNALTPHELIANYDDYESIYQQIGVSTVGNNQTIIDNTTPTDQQIIIGGIVTPVVEIPNLQLDRFSFCTVQSGLTFIYTLNIGVPELWEVVSINVTQHNSDDSTESHTIFPPNAQRIGYSLQLANFFSYTFSNGTIQNGPVFDFNINFSNGAIKSVMGINTMSVLRFCVRGFLEDGGVIPDNPIETPSFIPSGFGLKQIGIADYLKVEQTVQCYLEGEVSHIENIMAREYKEKSTRRLRRSEDTITTSSETEREQLTDTTTTDRFEMQTEVSKVIQESKDLAGSVNAGFNKNGFFLNAGMSYANNTSTENSTFQAVTEAQEITERALDRVVTKVKEERIKKVIEEFEENNKHGFDNRKGDQHVVGVYRWIDKLYKNQIYNYGKRMMFEFMIPDPAKLHLLGMKEELESGAITDFTPPIDPRTATGSFKMDGYSGVTESKVSYWAGIYNAEIEAKPESTISVGESFSIDIQGGAKLADVEGKSGSGKVTIPEGYKAISATGVFNAVSDNRSDQGRILSLTIGNKTRTYKNKFPYYSLFLDTSQIYTGSNNTEVTNSVNFSASQFGNEIPVSYTLGNHVSGDISVAIKCSLTVEAENRWKQEAFKAIMDAYYEALEEYNRKKEALETKAVEIKGTNPGFYRQIENTVLRKNCISYLISQNPDAQYTYGKDLSNGSNSFGGYEVNVNSSLDSYASFVKFIEQAFEWEIISYNFYPFYWSPRGSWVNKYQFSESDDPTFRAFMQAGMARVIVTVRPGFEEAVQLYLTTGQIWNGGQVPIMGDELYVDLIAEIQNIDKEKQGKAWVSRVPTSLTILQAKSIGLEVEKALPCNCDDLEDFENPEDVPCSEAFKLNEHKIGGEDGPEEPTE